MVAWKSSDLLEKTAMSADAGVKSKRILIIEDDPGFAESLRYLLSYDGAQPELADTGFGGLEKLAADQFDLVLLDLNLPDISGHEVICSAHERGVKTPMIVVSGESEIDAAILALRLGAIDFVRKPIEPEFLLYAVNRALSQAHLERQHLLAQHRIHRSEKLHRFLVDASPDLIFILDQSGSVSFINDRLQSLLGVDGKAVLGRHFSRLVHAHDRERARYAFSKRKLSETAKHSFELRLKSHADASGFRYFQVSLAAIGLPDGDEPGNGAGNELGNGCGDRDHYYGVARDTTARKEVEALANFQANHDALTGLPNRNLFHDHLALALIRARRNNELIAVLHLNLDRFKYINELFGHVQADALLRQVGERIQRCLRGGDTLARFVGDEFLLLNSLITTEQDVLQIVDRINLEFASPFTVGAKSAHISVSAGIALFPKHGDSADELIRHANIALYHGRLSGGKGHSFFMPEMGESTDQRLQLQSELRQAIDQNQFVLFYQPQVSLQDRRIRGVEALIRWNHPHRGLIPPGDFLPLAEEANLISSLDEWVTRDVCKTLRDWQRAGIAPPRVAINISPRHLEEADFVEKFIALLAEYAIDPAKIEVELTENLFIRDPNMVALKLQTLAAHGVMIAIDDFGTQYSSLSYLQKFPIHTLKIDKSFVWEIDRECRQHAIIKAIISIAHGLELNLVAEGVETDEQLRFLEIQGCDEIQGYLISKPLTRELLEIQLRQGGSLQSGTLQPD